MLEFRCTNCNKLLFKGDYRGTIQVMCSRCKTINEISIKNKNDMSITENT